MKKDMQEVPTAGDSLPIWRTPASASSFRFLAHLPPHPGDEGLTLEDNRWWN